MKLTAAIQEALVATVCFSEDTRNAQALMAMCPSSAFDPYYRELVESAGTYLEQYKKVPGEHTLDLVNGLVARFPEHKAIYKQLYASLSETAAGTNIAYVMDQASAFAKWQRMKRGIADAVDALAKEDAAGLMEAESFLAKAITGNKELTYTGTRMWEPAEAMRFLDKENEAMPVGIPELDKYQLGPARGKLHMTLGASSAGKSWWLTHLGKVASMNHLKVLHVSLEMSEDEVAQRYCMAFHSVSKRKATIEVQRFEKDQIGRLMSFSQEDLTGRPHFESVKIREHLRHRIEKRGKRGPILIRQFPTNGLTLRELGAYVNVLETRERFIPDLLLVDYPDLMAKDTKQDHRHAINTNVEGLRGLAVEKNIMLATVSQIGRAGDGAKLVTRKHVADDKRKIDISDIVFTLSKTKAEEKLNLARVFVDKSRNDQKNFEVLVSQAFEVGQFIMDSAMMVGSAYWPEVKRLTGGDDETEDAGDEE